MLPEGVELRDIPEKQRPFINDDGLILLKRGKQGQLVPYRKGIESAIRATEHIPESDSRQRRQDLQKAGEELTAIDFLNLRDQVLNIQTQVEGKHSLLGKLLRDIRSQVRKNILQTSADLGHLQTELPKHSLEHVLQQLSMFAQRLRVNANVQPYNQLINRLAFFSLQIDTAEIDTDQAIQELRFEIDTLLRETPIHPSGQIAEKPLSKK